MNENVCGLQSILGQLEDMLDVEGSPLHLNPFTRELDSFTRQIKRMIDGKMVLLASLADRPADSTSSGGLFLILILVFDMCF